MISNEKSPECSTDMGSSSRKHTITVWFHDKTVKGSTDPHLKEKMGGEREMAWTKKKQLSLLNIAVESEIIQYNWN